MVAPQAQPRAKVLEVGNVIFLYRPTKGVLHPQTSDQIEQVFLAMLPDNQAEHRNRLVTFAQGYLPPIIPGVELPEERGWAYVAEVGHDPLDAIGPLERESTRGENVPPPARVAGYGRYAIVRGDEHTYLAYVLSRPRQLGMAQQTLLMDQQGSYRGVVKEPFMPSDLHLEERPSYPYDLSERFDGHGSIPLDPTDFLDYRWTQIYLVADETGLKAALGLDLKPDVENGAMRKALHFLRDEAKRIQAESQLDIMKPLLRGQLE
jgi:hypothetical protein